MLKTPKTIKILSFVSTLALSFVTIAGGLAKLLRYPPEVAAYKSVDWSLEAIIALGIVQLIGGIAIFPRRTRAYGCLLSSLSFGISISFALWHDLTDVVVALTPVVLVGLITWCYWMREVPTNNRL